MNRNSPGLSSRRNALGYFASLLLGFLVPSRESEDNAVVSFTASNLPPGLSIDSGYTVVVTDAATGVSESQAFTWVISK
jgi:hypothetical protein